MIIITYSRLVAAGARHIVGAVNRIRYGCWLLASVAALNFGCVTAPDQEALDVTLVNLAGRNATVWETEAVVTVRLQNPTPNDITVSGAVHKIYLNGTYVGQGLSSESVTVPRLSTTTQNITVHLKNFTVLRKVIGMQETRMAAYKVQSKIYGSLGGGRSRSFRAMKEGFVSLDQLLTSAEVK